MIYDENTWEEDFVLRMKKLLEKPVGVDKFFQHRLGLYEIEDEPEMEFVSLVEVL
jgi:hypothetical protein